MPTPTSHLAIDARPRGPGGPLAGARLQGRSVLAHLLDLARSVGAETVVIHAHRNDKGAIQDAIPAGIQGRVVHTTEPPPEQGPILRADRLYDPVRFRRAWKRGIDLETAVFWRLDRPGGLAGAEDEWARRQSYQPLGRYWALAPARRLACGLCPTRVRPNALTLTVGGLMLATAAGVAWAPLTVVFQVILALTLALALVLDTADGHLARLQGTASAFGRGLDVFLDELGDMALHAAIAWATFVRTGQPGWLVLGMLYGMGKYQFVVGTSAWDEKPGRDDSGARGEANDIGKLGALVRSGVRLAGHADVRWHLWIVLAAVGRLDAALAAYAVYFPVRALIGAARRGARRG